MWIRCTLLRFRWQWVLYAMEILEVKVCLELGVRFELGGSQSSDHLCFTFNIREQAQVRFVKNKDLPAYCLEIACLGVCLGVKTRSHNCFWKKGDKNILMSAAHKLSEPQVQVWFLIIFQGIAATWNYSSVGPCVLHGSPLFLFPLFFHSQYCAYSFYSLSICLSISFSTVPYLHTNHEMSLWLECRFLHV